MKKEKRHYFLMSIKNKLEDESIHLSISEDVAGTRKTRTEVIKPGGEHPSERFDESNKKEISISCEKGNKKKYYIKEVVTSVENPAEVLRESVSAFNGIGGVDNSYKMKTSFPKIPARSGDYHFLQTNDNVTIGDKEP